MNKAESKYFHTALLMDEALLSLLEKKDFEYITVKELCMQAGVNRSTFYLHYETLGDLLAECLAYSNKQFLDSFAGKPSDFIPRIDAASLSELVLINSEVLRPYLSFVAQHKSIFRAVYKNPACMQANRQYQDISDYILRPIMKRFQISEQEQAYWITFYMHGTMAIIQEWIKGNCTDSVEAMERVLLHCIRPENWLRDSRQTDMPQECRSGNG